MKRLRTSAYVTTVDSKKSMTVDLIKASVRAINEDLKFKEQYSKTIKPRYRVSLKGRAGKNNPDVTKAQMRAGAIPHEFAVRFDVYIHEATRSSFTLPAWHKQDFFNSYDPEKNSVVEPDNGNFVGRVFRVRETKKGNYKYYPDHVWPRNKKSYLKFSSLDKALEWIYKNKVCQYIGC